MKELRERERRNIRQWIRETLTANKRAETKRLACLININLSHPVIPPLT